MKERVIFRIEKDPYINETKYLAVFPDEQANYGRIAALPFYFDKYDRTIFEPFTEISFDYYYGTKRVRKNSHDADICLKTVEEYFNDEFRVMEKIM